MKPNTKKEIEQLTYEHIMGIAMKNTRHNAASGLWGELPSRETLKQDVITPDIIENVWRQVMEESNTTDCDYHLDNQSDYIELPMGNVHVLNTIHLHQQLRMMDEGMVLGNVTMIDTQISKDIKYFQKSLHLLHKNQKRPIFKNSSVVHHLTSTTVHNLLRHAVIVLVAHIGFEKSLDVAIETLTDIVDCFLRRITRLIKTAYEQEDQGFPDAMERVLLETGVGGVASLHDYYHEYVIKFEQNMVKKVEAMIEKQRMVLDEAASKLQFEELDEFGNVYPEVPTLQLLDPEMGFPPSLDAGFQMLYSLEQDELNSLEVEEEEVNVSDSPNTAQCVESSSEKRRI